MCIPVVLSNHYLPMSVKSIDHLLSVGYSSSQVPRNLNIDPQMGVIDVPSPANRMGFWAKSREENRGQGQLSEVHSYVWLRIVHIDCQDETSRVAAGYFCLPSKKDIPLPLNVTFRTTGAPPPGQRRNHLIVASFTGHLETKRQPCSQK